MNYWFITASALSAFICLLHVFGGGPTTVPHLVAKQDAPGGVGRMTAYYAWHLVTITLAGMSLAFWMASKTNGAIELAWFASIGALAFALWSLAMIAIYKLKPLLFPQWILFFPVAFVGLAGILL